MLSKKILLYLFASLLMIGCASRSAIQQPSLFLDKNAQHDKAESNGIELLVKAIHSKDDLKTYYDEDTLKYGVLPIQLYVHNKSTKTFVINSDEVNVFDENGNKVSMMSLEEVYGKMKKSMFRAGGWAVATGIFAVFSVHNITKINTELKADIKSRMFKGDKLIPQSSAEGTLFCKVPMGLSSLNGWKLAVAATDKASGEKTSIEYNLYGDIMSRKAKNLKKEED